MALAVCRAAVSIASRALQPGAGLGSCSSLGCVTPCRALASSTPRRDAPERDAAQRLLALRRENEVRACISQVLLKGNAMDAALPSPSAPLRGRRTDPVRSGAVQRLRVEPESGEVEFALSPGFPVGAVAEALEQLPWVTQVSVGAAQPVSKDTKPEGLRGVENIVCVSSCKGGVGKSTVAVNLAFALAARDLRIGLLDADIFGPSLPTMTSPEKAGLFQQSGTELIAPVIYHGVKCMSYGFAGKGAAMVRGPVVSRVTSQLATGTAWGELDYLVVDMPPGTGDVHLTLCQQLELSAAVVVTTPQSLSVVDVLKGIEMFDTLKVPCVALVENMAYFECEHGSRYEIFGPSCVKHVTTQYGIPEAVRIPLETATAKSGDAGRPYVLDHATDATTTAKAFNTLADAVQARCTDAAAERPEMAYDPEQNRLVLCSMGTEVSFTPHALRAACRCAACEDEVSGERTVGPMDVDASVRPLSIEAKGNYAVGIRWSDRHASIYPFESLWDLAQAES
eukprot:m.130294 g.130294  ORF g.130294 m.130294 type:complete len:510 (-) comp16784_c0_seq1:110-1639(-)